MLVNNGKLLELSIIILEFWFFHAFKTLIHIMFILITVKISNIGQIFPSFFIRQNSWIVIGSYDKTLGIRNKIFISLFLVILFFFLPLKLFLKASGYLKRWKLKAFNSFDFSSQNYFIKKP